MRMSAIPGTPAAAVMFLLPGLVGAQTIDNETVTITDWFQAFGGYDVQFAIDTGDDRFLSDYASQGGSNATFIEFDFGMPYEFSEIILTDRVTSGGPNFVWFGGLFDYNTAYNYIFSVDNDFTNGDGVTDDIVVFVEPEPPDIIPVPQDEIELLQTATEIPEIRAQYLRWEVVATNGNNPGVADFEFIAKAEGESPQVFVRGDANSDGQINLTDGISILGHLFIGNAEPACFAAAKATGSPGGLNITDAVFIFTWLFAGGDDPPPPTPSAGTYLAADCGPDPLGEEGLGCLTPAAKCRQ